MKITRRAAIVALLTVYLMRSEGYRVWAEEDDEDEATPAQLVQRLQGGTVSLAAGVGASQRESTPISGEFEVDDGTFQLSVYTQKGERFAEVVLDPKTGTIGKVDPITRSGDLAAAPSHAEAMARAKQSLIAAVEEAEQVHPGTRAISVYPGIQGGHAGAEVALMAGDVLQTVPESLEQSGAPPRGRALGWRDNEKGEENGSDAV